MSQNQEDRVERLLLEADAAEAEDEQEEELLIEEGQPLPDLALKVAYMLGNPGPHNRGAVTRLIRDIARLELYGR